MDSVNEGYARKLVNMRHGQFRVAELYKDHAVRLETASTPYRIFPVVHVFNLKRVVNFSDRKSGRLMVDNGDCVDFNKSLLPEDRSIIDLYADGC